jgi:hypothetical protein
MTDRFIDESENLDPQRAVEGVAGSDELRWLEGTHEELGHVQVAKRGDVACYLPKEPVFEEVDGVDHEVVAVFEDDSVRDLKMRYTLFTDSTESVIIYDSDGERAMSQEPRIRAERAFPELSEATE